ncbi:MAG TPA: 30S ribosomal protein S6 [Kofleriaceae bacterium]|nr:30S ribosomal protein S6 [Kofleriaceae bacterium]
MAPQLTSLADAPGTLREYETIYILKPDTQQDGIAEVNQRVRTIIEDAGGKVLRVDNWGKRKLAYEIRKQLKGIYLYWQYLSAPPAVAEIERNMRMLDTVIRYMTVKLGTDVVPDARTSELDDDSFERATVTAADEEELMLRGAADRSEDEVEAEGSADDSSSDDDSSDDGSSDDDSNAATTGDHSDSNEDD